MRVRDWMTAPVVTVAPTTSVLNARRLLDLHGIRHLPVVEGGRVVGMLSDRDLRVRDAGLTATLAAIGSDYAYGRYRAVAAVMSKDVRCTQPSARLEEAAAEMLGSRVGALPVVEHGRMVGLLTVTDCVHALLNEHEVAAAPPTGTAEVRLDDAPTPRMPSGGDARPGRPPGQPIALVVDPDPARRAATVDQLRAEGYLVATCPGPLAGVLCPAITGATPQPCARIPSGLALVVLDEGSAAAGLPAAYRQWAPGAEIRIGGLAAARR